MPTWLARMIDGADHSVDAPTVMGGSVLLTHVALTAYDVFMAGHAFNPQSFGTGTAAIIAAIGTAGWFRKPGAPAQKEGE